MKRYISIALILSIYCVKAQVDTFLYIANHTDDIKALTFSPDGKYVLSGGWDNTLTIQYNDSVGTVAQRIKGYSGAINSIAMSRDGKKLISGGQNGKLLIHYFESEYFELATLDTSLSLSNSQINKLVYGPGMRAIFSANDDGKLIMYDIVKQEARPIQGNRPITAMAVAIDRMSYFVAYEGSPDIFQIDIFGKLLKTYTGHSNDITDLEVSIDRKTLISSSRDKTIKVWNIAQAKATYTFIEHSWAVTDIDIDAFGKFLVSGALDGNVHIYNLTDGSLLQQIHLENYKINAIALSPDNTQIVAAAHLTSPADSTGYFVLPSGLKAIKVAVAKPINIEEIRHNYKQRLKVKNKLQQDKASEKKKENAPAPKKNKKKAEVPKTLKEQVKITINDNE